MNDFFKMLEEALKGDEPSPPHPDREALESALRGFETRHRTVMTMTFLGVFFMSALCVAMIVLLVRADDDVRLGVQLTYLALFVLGISSIGIIKFWMVVMHNHLAVMKELKRMQLQRLEGK